MKFDDLARNAAKAVRDQVEGHPLPGMERRGSPLRRVAVALGAAVLVTGAVLGATGVLRGDRTDTVDEPPSTTLSSDTTTTQPASTSPTTLQESPSTSIPTQMTVPAGEGGEWLSVPHDPEVLAAARMEAITNHNDSTLVAVGFTTSGNTLIDQPLAWWSVDGIAWQRVEIEAENAALFDVASAGGRLVAVGSSDHAAAVWTSIDGTAWTPVVTPEGVFQRTRNSAITAVAAYQDGFVAVGQETLIELSDALEGGYADDEYQRAVVWTSPDGSTWTRIENPSFGGSGFTTMLDVATNGSTLVAVGSTGLYETTIVPRAWFSEDGRSWQSALIDDDSEYAFMTTVTTDGQFYYAAGSDLSEGLDTGAKWAGDGGGWERDGVIEPSGELGVDVRPSSYLVTPRGRVIVSEFPGSVWFIDPSGESPFSPVWAEFPLDPPVNDPNFGDAIWVGDRVVVVGSHWDTTDGAMRSAVWQWIPPEPVVTPTVEVPDPNGPLCSAVERISPDSALWDEVAAALFEQVRVRLGLTDENQPVYVEGVIHDGSIALIVWFDRGPGGMTLWVGETIENGWAFTAVWDRFGGSAEEILGAIDAAFPNAPPGLLCIDTEAFRTQ